jgi:hypothetical protein
MSLREGQLSDSAPAEQFPSQPHVEQWAHPGLRQDAIPEPMSQWLRAVIRVLRESPVEITGGESKNCCLRCRESPAGVLPVHQHDAASHEARRVRGEEGND